MMTQEDIKKYIESILLIETEFQHISEKGSGFVFFQERDVVWVATCSHLLYKNNETYCNLLIDQEKYKTYLIAKNKDYDLAILKIEGLEKPPLQLQLAHKYQENQTCKLLGRSGTNTKNSLNGTIEQCDEYTLNNENLFNLKIKDDPDLLGYSGGAIINSNTGCVIGVQREQQDTLGIAITVDALHKLLLDQDSKDEEKDTLKKIHFLIQLNSLFLQAKCLDKISPFLIELSRKLDLQNIENNDNIFECITKIFEQGTKSNNEVPILKIVKTCLSDERNIFGFNRQHREEIKVWLKSVAEYFLGSDEVKIEDIKEVDLNENQISSLLIAFRPMVPQSKEIEPSPKKYQIELWFSKNSKAYEYINEESYIYDEHNEKIINYIISYISQNVNNIDEFRIELTLPISLMDCNPYNLFVFKDNWGYENSLSNKYPTVVRSYDRLLGHEKALLDSNWKKTSEWWENFGQEICNFNHKNIHCLNKKEVDCLSKKTDHNCLSKGLEILYILPCKFSKIETKKSCLFKMIRNGASIALWLDDLESEISINEAKMMLEQDLTLNQLALFLKERRSYGMSETNKGLFKNLTFFLKKLGFYRISRTNRGLFKNLVLLWDDPNRIPPEPPLQRELDCSHTKS